MHDYLQASGGFIFDQMLKILVWDDFGSIKLSNRLFGVEQFWLNFEICAK